MKYNLLLLIFILSLVSSCKKHEETDDFILLEYEGNVLTEKDVLDLIPVGIEPADSIALFHTIVEDWVKDKVLTNFAESRLYDVESIDRKARAYRNALIIEEYVSRMRESQAPKIDEKSVKDYYDQHRAELKLEMPLVKGVFLKINSDSKGKESIKRLITSKENDRIDELENSWLDKSLEYNYFRDKWVDWETITEMIPMRFGNPDEFISDNDYIETDYGDCTYYLFISDKKHSGEEQPFEYARTWIIDKLTQKALSEYEKELVTSLVSKSIKENKLNAFGYDPLRHTMKDK